MNLFNPDAVLKAVRPIVEKVPGIVSTRVKATGVGGGSEKRPFSAYNSRYAGQRRAKGLQTGHKDFTVSNTMWGSYQIVKEATGDSSVSFDLGTTDGKGSNGQYLSDIHSREDFRRVSVTQPACIDQIYGVGFDSYLKGIDRLVEYLRHS